MIKQLVVALAAFALSACAAPSQATTQTPDFCDLISARDLARQLDEPITVTKRLLEGPSSPWAYCLYGTMTQHFVTLSAPIAHPAGNIHVMVDPKVADRVQASVDPVRDDYQIAPVDLPAECAALRSEAEAVVGTITSARGSVNPGVLTCDFIGPDGSIAAQSRPHVLAEHTVLTGVDILDKPDARLKATVGENIHVDGIVDHRGIDITVHIGRTQLTEAIKAFAQKFLEASK
ncbi:hypothetical protein [Smaragdicoccus niigatensis]|uniref:hypothetical protein n=1 Tax=Smaragdicoccus niigatensis TaxID=359359 RepID=UPI00036D4827|nr:hypothetical protein [Smaragdicoccus niigatensis]